MDRGDYHGDTDYVNNTCITIPFIAYCRFRLKVRTSEWYILKHLINMTKITTLLDSIDLPSQLVNVVDVKSVII